jgi:hypothetical protein
MKRLFVQEAFVGEPNPEQEGLAAWGEQDEAVVLRVESGRLVIVVPADTPSQQEFDAAQFLAIELTLEDGRTLTVDIQGDAVGAHFSVERPRRDGVRPLAATELSTVWAASA